jgi:predicted TIM-barrel fold metal-dependent hydrolase
MPPSERRIAPRKPALERRYSDTLLERWIGTKLIDEMGVETIMWASHYPHTDGVWPEPSKYIAEQFGHPPPDVVRKITYENAGKFYGLMT